MSLLFFVLEKGLNIKIEFKKTTEIIKILEVNATFLFKTSISSHQPY